MDRQHLSLFGKTTDDGTADIQLGSIAVGQSKDFIITWSGKKPDTLARICGVTRILATNNAGSIDFLLSGGNPEIELQAPVYDAALTGATLTAGSSSNNVFITLTGVAAVGVVNWQIEVATRTIFA